MSVGKARYTAPAFSLLEVILATAIIAASSMVLLRLISTGTQHQHRGERRATGQMICQSLIDQMMINPELQQSVENQDVKGHPEWKYTTQIEPTGYQGLVRVRVRAAEAPENIQRTRNDGDYDFELVRWIRIEKSNDDSESGSEDLQ